jgi:hypothetical protein
MKISARSALWTLAVATSALALLVPQRASAQARLDAHYDATLAGIVLGKGVWVIEIYDDTYTAAAQGGTTGLAKAFAQGSGTSYAQGRVSAGALVPNGYSATTTTSKKTEAIHITLQNGNVKEFGIDPVPPVDPDRIPVTEAHKKGVFDPMTASLVRVPGNGDPVSPEACHNGAAVFDGRMRYDLKLDFKRMEMVKTEHGYQGPAVVCSIYFAPIAGYIPDRPVIKYLAGARNIELTLAPIAGTRYLVPYRMVIPTSFGTAMLEATQFVTQPIPPHVAKTQ